MKTTLLNVIAIGLITSSAFAGGQSPNPKNDPFADKAEYDSLMAMLVNVEQEIDEARVLLSELSYEHQQVENMIVDLEEELAGATTSSEQQEIQAMISYFTLLCDGYDGAIAQEEARFATLQTVRARILLQLQALTRGVGSLSSNR